MNAIMISDLFAGNIRRVLTEEKLNYKEIYEIRLRTGQPLLVSCEEGECFIKKNGKDYIVTKEDLRETLEYITGYSAYACGNEIRQGYISLPGGHRAGITGKVILEGDKITGLESISAINIRLSHQIIGCAERVMPYIQDQEKIYHTLIISPPGCGKTTLLRDIIRQLSNGRAGFQGKNVGVIDERSEIAACFQGIPQNDLGIRSDILDGCPKAEGMQMLLRSMSPDVIAVDELGKEEDYQAVEAVIHCGCKMIATAHGYSVEEMMRQPFFQKMREKKIFERYIFLEKRKKAGVVKGIYDRDGCIC